MTAAYADPDKIPYLFRIETTKPPTELTSAAALFILPPALVLIIMPPSRQCTIGKNIISDKTLAQPLPAGQGRKSPPREIQKSGGAAIYRLARRAHPAIYSKRLGQI